MDTTLTIRTNKDIKDQAQALFAELGLDMTTAINMFLRQAVREDGLPFAARKEKMEKPNFKTRRAIKRAEKGKGLVGPFKTVEELMEYLNA